MPAPHRLGVYVDDIYRETLTAGRPALSSDRPFVLFALEVAGHRGGLTLFGRVEQSDEPFEHVLPEATRIVALPPYPSLTEIGAVLRALPGTARAMWSGLAGVDTVWVFGPHPFGLVLVMLAALRRRRVVLGVRQDTLSYYRSRVRSRAWKPALMLTWMLDRAYRLLARRLPIAVVGEEIARAYGDGPNVLAMTVTLIRADQVVATPPERDWTGKIELLTVGRIDPEKNPSLLLDAIRELESRQPGRLHLTWAGRGPLEEDVLARVRDLGLEDSVTLAGYVPFGEELLALYRSSNMFVHVSLTEGVPQVLIEAFATGLPVVATDVGGVAAAVGRGEAALLVPPGELAPLVTAIERLLEDPVERDRLAEAGLARARALTLEHEGARVASFVAAGRVPPGPP